MTPRPLAGIPFYASADAEELTLGDERWRRERDSNPRYPFEVLRLSKTAPSPTRPSLQKSITRTDLASAGPSTSESCTGLGSCARCSFALSRSAHAFACSWTEGVHQLLFLLFAASFHEVGDGPAVRIWRRFPILRAILAVRQSTVRGAVNIERCIPAVLADHVTPWRKGWGSNPQYQLPSTLVFETR
jgi:hypothetical protein